MDDGWEQSAGAWIASIGDKGDWGREHVLDPVMLERISAGQFERALDVGCGEGRFCRLLKAKGILFLGSTRPRHCSLRQGSGIPAATIN